MQKYMTKRGMWGLLSLMLAVVLVVILLVLLCSPESGGDASAETPVSSEPAVSESPTVSETPMAEAAEAPAAAEIPSAEQDRLQKIIEDLRMGTSGNWDIRVETLDGSRVAAATTVPGRSMVAANIIKLFIMAAVYHSIDQGSLSHDQCYPFLHPMITFSDNYSTNELIRLLGGGDAAAGMEAVNSYAAQLGCTGTQLNRLMLAGNGLENYTTAADCALVLRMICSGTLVSADWSAEMLELLKAQTLNNRLPAGLPGVPCAHKTGDLSGLCCADVGIVFAPGGDYIICAICNYPKNDYNAIQAIVSLSASVYAELNP